MGACSTTGHALSNLTQIQASNCPPPWGVGGAGDQTQGFAHARQAFYMAKLCSSHQVSLLDCRHPCPNTPQRSPQAPKILHVSKTKSISSSTNLLLLCNLPFTLNVLVAPPSILTPICKCYLPNCFQLHFILYLSDSLIQAGIIIPPLKMSTAQSATFLQP